jgi:oligopeptide/dipeptide ABC transporter ATP-binding protein
MDFSSLLEVKDLTVSYRLGRRVLGKRTTLDAVRNISFEIRAGETFGLVGESGSGKSTTGRAILRLADVSGGRIMFDGIDIREFGNKTPLEYRRDVQVIFQDPASSLNPRQTVGATLSQIVRRHHSLSETQVKAEVLTALHQVGLSEHHYDRLPGALSGGQRQRVAIARAVIVRPRLIICDEPVSALDLSTQSQVINLLMDLQDEMGISYLFVAHDLAVVRHISSRVGVMYLGRLVEVGNTADVYRRPAHPYTRILLDSSLTANPDVEAERRERRAANRSIGEPASPLDVPPGCPFNPRCPLAVDRCRTERPQLRPIAGTSQMAACHFAEDVVESVDLVKLAERMAG